MIDANRVHELCMSALWTPEQIEAAGGQEQALAQAHKVDGLVRQYAFHPESLEKTRAEVGAMLRCLDSSFMESGGGGMSFMQMPFDRSGAQWGEQSTAEALLMLGLALGYCEYLLSRDLWVGLPGGVPYIVVKDSLIGAAQ